MPIDRTAVEPPNKRRKVEDTRVTTPASSAKAVTVKQELSPSPPPSVALRTSGTEYIKGVPVACRKTSAGWKEQRDKWVKEETLKLKRLGFQVTKRLIRDDGLALDWISPVPVNPSTLRAPSPDAQTTQVNSTLRASIALGGPSPDPLGHALHEQSSLSGLSAHRTSDEVSARPRETDSRVSQPFADEGSGPSEFAVVGAALFKKGRIPDQDPHVHLLPPEPVQKEHRKLLPAELRMRPPVTGYKETVQDWRARRKAWVAREMEKVEGYTGGQARGFKYDGDDVIIYVQTHHTPNDGSRHRTKPINAPPSHVKSVRHETAIANGEMQSQARINSPDISPRSSSVSGPDESGASRGLSGGLSAVLNQEPDQLRHYHSETSVVAPVYSVTDPGDEGIPSEHGQEIPDYDAGTLDATHARGLGFLEQYLQMFDGDRGSLGVAYTANSTLSLQVEEGYCNLSNASKVSPRPSTSRMVQIITTGPVAIVDTLQQLDGHLHHSTFCDIEYNIAALDDMSVDGLLLTCDGVMVHPEHPMQPPRWSFSRTFILKQNLETSEGSLSFWPMKIVAERLTIRKTPEL